MFISYHLPDPVGYELCLSLSHHMGIRWGRRVSVPQEGLEQEDSVAPSWKQDLWWGVRGTVLPRRGLSVSGGSCAGRCSGHDRGPASITVTLILGNAEDRRRAHREWDGLVASLTQRTWIWAKSRRQWRTGKSGMLQSLGLKRVRHGLATEKQYDTSWVSLPGSTRSLHAKVLLLSPAPGHPLILRFMHLSGRPQVFNWLKGKSSLMPKRRAFKLPGDLMQLSPLGLAG